MPAAVQTQSRTDPAKVHIIAALAALAQETRLDLYRRLVGAGRSGRPAGALAVDLGVPPPTLSFHLKELGAAGLIRAEREGRTIRYFAEFTAMRDLIGYLTANCCRDEETSDAAPSCFPDCS